MLGDAYKSRKGIVIMLTDWAIEALKPAWRSGISAFLHLVGDIS